MQVVMLQGVARMKGSRSYFIHSINPHLQLRLRNATHGSISHSASCRTLSRPSSPALAGKLPPLGGAAAADAAAGPAPAAPAAWLPACCAWAGLGGGATAAVAARTGGASQLARMGRQPSCPGE